MAYTSLGWGVRLNLDVWVHKQYAAENRTEFQAVLSLVDVNSARPYHLNGSAWSVRSPNSTTQKSGNISSYDFRNYSRIELSRSIISFPHNADGSFSARQWTGHFSDAGPIGSGVVTVNSVGAPSIARATTAIWADSSTPARPGETKKLLLPRASSAFTHDVTYTVGNATGLIGNNLTTEVNWAIPISILEQFPNSPSIRGRIDTVTKNGSTVVGKTSSVSDFIPRASDGPKVSGITWSDTNATVSSKIGAIVQNMSKVKGTVNATSDSGASIVSTSITLNGEVIPPNAVFEVPTAATFSALGEATDSRGLTSSKTTNLTVLPYENPKLGANGWSVSRANVNNVVDPTGKYLRIDLHAIVKSLVNGSEKNALKVKVTTRPTNGAPAPRNDFTHGSLTHNSAFQVTGGDQFSTTQSYVVTVEVTDNAGGKLTLTDTVSTAAATLDMNGTSVGIGKMHERGTLDVGGDTYVGGRLHSTNATINGVPDEVNYKLQKVLYYKTNATFTKSAHPYARALRVKVQAGGGGGGGSQAASNNSNSFGTGGGGGGYAESFITNMASVPASTAVTVGAGGSGGAIGGAGTDGGTSSFGTLVSASGGGGGYVKPNNAFNTYIFGGNPGTGNTGELCITGSGGGNGTGTASFGVGGHGGGSVLGGGANAAGTGAGGGSSVGLAGGVYGGGGSGGSTNAGGPGKFGGVGAPGIVIVEVYG